MFKQVDFVEQGLSFYFGWLCFDVGYFLKVYLVRLKWNWAVGRLKTKCVTNVWLENIDELVYNEMSTKPTTKAGTKSYHDVLFYCAFEFFMRNELLFPFYAL